VFRDAIGALSLILLGVLVLAVVIFGGWKLHWWFRGQEAQLGGQTNRGSYGFQQAHMDQTTSLISDISRIDAQIAAADPAQKPTLAAQRTAEVAETCRLARDIQNPPADILSWHTLNCSAP